MEFSGYGGHKGYSRLFLGAAPVLYAWPTLALDPTSALIAQWLGFTGLWWADLKATNAGWSKSRTFYRHVIRTKISHLFLFRLLIIAPGWYSQYRFYLSILVGTWYVEHNV